MPERRTSERGVGYLAKPLKRKATVLTEACLWSIPRSSGINEIHLKLGRYTLAGGRKLQSEKPRSELTLDDDEFTALLTFLRENLEPFRLGARQWIALDEHFGREQADQLK